MSYNDRQWQESAVASYASLALTSLASLGSAASAAYATSSPAVGMASAAVVVTIWVAVILSRNLKVKASV